VSSWKQQALIDAPVPDVWDLLCDPTRAPQWSEDVLAVTGAPTRVEKGSTFELTTRGPLGIKATTPFRVEELDDMHELKLKCQVSGFYSRWILTDAQGGTFTEVELGVEPLEHRRPIAARAVGALHTKAFLRRSVEELLDGLRRALGGSRSDADAT
jgi:uncharacterized protein YndB with AHSA1/START domain